MINTIELAVYPPLEQDFRELVQKENGKITWNTEIIMGKWVILFIEVDNSKNELINDMAFMTFVKNPKFQKYYTNSENYKKIANEYITNNGS